VCGCVWLCVAVCGCVFGCGCRPVRLFHPSVPSVPPCALAGTLRPLTTSSTRT
jgi:hypothetical protein